MKMLADMLRELAGLFVDDGALALAIVTIVVLAGIVAAMMPGLPLVAGAILLFGCLVVLVLNVARAARR
jgi:uncharacterized membrane protein YdjX (TVP38/TMEM64 family)